MKIPSCVSCTKGLLIGSSSVLLAVFAIFFTFTSVNAGVFLLSNQPQGIVKAAVSSQSSYYITSSTSSYSIIIPPSSWVVNKTAKDLLEAIPNCTSVSKWDKEKQQWFQYVPAVPPTNFNLESGKGYAISVSKDTLVYFSGLQDQTVVLDLPRTSQAIDQYQFVLPDNWIGKKASDLLKQIEFGGAVAYYDITINGWTQYIPGIPPTDFILEAGRSYVVQISRDTSFNATTSALTQPKLKASMANVSGDQSVVAGENDKLFANIILDATGSSEDIKVTRFLFTHQTSKAGIQPYLTNITLYDGNTVINVPKAGTDSNSTQAVSSIDFANALIISKGTTKTLSLRADISGSAENSTTHQFIINTGGILAFSNVSNNVVTVEGSYPLNGGLILINSTGILKTSNDFTNPAAGNVLANATTKIGAFKFEATNENIQISKVGFNISGSANTYHNIQLLQLFDGAIKLGEIYVTGPTVTITTSGLTIIKNSSKIITLKAVTSKVGLNEAGVVGENFVVAVNSIDAKGEISGSSAITKIGLTDTKTNSQTIQATSDPSELKIYEENINATISGSVANSIYWATNKQANCNVAYGKTMDLKNISGEGNQITGFGDLIQYALSTNDGKYHYAYKNLSFADNIYYKIFCVDNNGVTKSSTARLFSASVFSWVSDSWGTCVNGAQTRSVVCKSSSGAVFSDGYCSGNKPAISQSCVVNTISFKSKPIIGKVPLATNFLNGTNEIYKFTVAADTNGDIALRKVTFQLFKEGDFQIINPELYGNFNASVLASKSGVFDGDVLTFYLDQPDIVSAGSTKTYSLRVGLTNYNTSDGLFAKIVGDVGEVQQPVLAYQVSGNFIWSDLSVSSVNILSLPQWFNGATISSFDTQAIASSASYFWFAGVWGTCANSTQTRSVVCKDNNGGNVVADNLCTATKPATGQSCSVNSATAKLNPYLARRLKGMLLLQVEQGGEIWYVDPINYQRHSATWDNALPIFQKFALGISNNDLLKIPVNMYSIDPNLDTDSDGYTDTVELQNNFTPYGIGKNLIGLDKNLANELKGKFLLQVEQGGAIWYVDMDGVRHNVRWNNLINLFRDLALGITDNDLNKIETGN